jgi:hypothetical protein
MFWTTSFKAQYSESWLLLLAVFWCSFATAIVKTSRIPRIILTVGCFFAAFNSDISQRLVLVECPSPQPSPSVRGEGARPRVGLTRLIKLAQTPNAA